MRYLRAEVDELDRELLERLATNFDEVERDYTRALAGIEEVLIAVNVLILLLILFILKTTFRRQLMCNSTTSFAVVFRRARGRSGWRTRRRVAWRSCRR